jgi:inorganic pyrophosphatase
LAAFPVELSVLVEIPRASFIKRRPNGAVDFISPLPCPFNYGCVPDTRAADGDPEDVLVLGPRLSEGTRVRVPVLARANFVDAGAYDGKWICGHELKRTDMLQLVAFFEVYARAKRWLNRRRGLRGDTTFAGIERAHGVAGDEDR